MKKSIALLTIALMFVSVTNAQTWGNKKVKGNGDITTETRNTGDYDGIKCAGTMDFILVAGNEGEIKLEGESNLLEHIVTEIKGGNLIVKVKKGYSLRSSKYKGIKITIPFKEINVVSLAGSGDIVSQDKITSNKLSVSLAGSGDIVLDVETNELVGSLAGSGDLTLKGKTNDFKISLAGSGDFHAFDLKSENAEASLAGSGDIKISCNIVLKVRIAGSGDIEYKGSPKVTKKVSGSGSVSKN
jgi:hypothetical protein